MEKIVLTRAGYEKLLRELELLCGVERPQAVSEVLNSPQDGRPEKNPDFQLAVARRRRLDRRIQQLQQILANAEVVVGSNLTPTQVRLHSRVMVLNLDTSQTMEFRLVSPVEADASRGDLSASSPLGRALLGRAPGEEVHLETPSGPRKYQIIEIQADQI